MFAETATLTTLLSAVLVTAIVIRLVQYVWGRRWLYYHASKLEGPLSFPLMGSAHRFLGGQDVFLDKAMGIVEEYHSGTNTISKLWLGNILLVIVTQPSDVELFLTKFLKKPDLYNFLKEAVGNSLAIAPVEIWKPHRKVINQTFSPKILECFIDVFDTYAEAIVSKMDDLCDKSYIDVFPLLFQTTLNMICETSLGIRMKDVSEASQYLMWMTRMQSRVTHRLFRIWLHPDFIWKLTSMYKEFSETCANLWKCTGEIVATKRQQKDLNYLAERKIFLDHLLGFIESAKWQDKEVMEETQFLMFAGSETTAITQSFTLVMLAMHQDVQDKVFNEIVEVFGEEKRSPTVEDLNRLEYLERVIKETMRLFPVVPLLGRSVTKDVALKTCTVPRGAVVALPVLFIHRSPKLWPDPLKFDPDRFLPQEVAKRHKYAYLPFSLGPRDCVGQRYAMLSMKTVLYRILRQYQISSTEYKSVEDVKLGFNVVLKAVKGFKVAIKRRHL